jgi:hypothetical protein
MAHDASALPLNKAPCPSFRRHSSVTTSHSLACFTASPTCLPHILPVFHQLSCAYPPTPIAAPWYPREPHSSAPTRSLPTSHPNRRPTVSPTPSPSQPTQTQRLLRCTASTCDPLRRLIDPLRHLLTARHHQSHCCHSSGSPRCPSRKTLITLRLALVNAWGISQHHSIEPPCFNPILIQSRFLARLDTTCLVHLLHPPLELHINHVVLQTPESRSLDDAAFPGAPDAGLGYVGH